MGLFWDLFVTLFGHKLIKNWRKSWSRIIPNIRILQIRALKYWKEGNFLRIFIYLFIYYFFLKNPWPWWCIKIKVAGTMHMLKLVLLGATLVMQNCQDRWKWGLHGIFLSFLDVFGSLIPNLDDAKSYLLSILRFGWKKSIFGKKSFFFLHI